jgi:putative phosphoribosyl transferase
MTRQILIDAEGGRLAGTLTVPLDAGGLVLFAHGSGSSQHSPGDRRVAHELQSRRVATLLLDLWTPVEDVDDAPAAREFDIPPLAARLARATDWTQRDTALAGLPLGYFGSSTGAAVALWAAADRAEVVQTVVCRSGRPELASNRLTAVKAATLLIVGGADHAVAEWNRQAFETLRITTEAQLDVVCGATHLFDEPGAPDVVADLAVAWFLRHFRAFADMTGWGAGARSFGR